jgi:hypothetical protein
MLLLIFVPIVRQVRLQLMDPEGSITSRSPASPHRRTPSFSAASYSSRSPGIGSDQLQQSKQQQYIGRTRVSGLNFEIDLDNLPMCKRDSEKWNNCSEVAIKEEEDDVVGSCTVDDSPIATSTSSIVIEDEVELNC